MVSTVIFLTSLVTASLPQDFISYPGTVRTMTVAEFAQNDALAIVSPVSRSVETRPSKGGSIEVTVDRFRIEDSTTLTPGSVVSVIVRHPHPPKHPEVSGVPNESIVTTPTYILVGKKPVNGLLPFLNFDNLRTGRGAIYETMPASSATELAGFLLIRSDQHALAKGGDLASTFLHTLAQSVASADQEVAREALVTVWCLSFGYIQSPIEGEPYQTWKTKNLTPQLRAAESAPSAYTRILAYATLSDWERGVPDATPGLLKALKEYAATNQSLDMDAQMMVSAATFGGEGAPATAYLDTASRVYDGWLQQMLISRMPEPTDAPTYNRLVQYLDDPEPATVYVTATALSRFAHRPDLKPTGVWRGNLRVGELTALSTLWHKVPFAQLHTSEKVIAKRTEGITSAN